MADFADPNEVRNVAEAMPDIVLWHRLMGHGSGFQPYTVQIVKDGNKFVAYEQILRCTCGVTKTVLLSKSGTVMSAPYNYKDANGYLMEKGFGRIVGEGKDVLRLESIMRHLKKQED